MTDHALFSPSAAHRWLICTASPMAERECPNTTSAASERGTKIHEMAAAMFQGRSVPGLPDHHKIAKEYVKTVQEVAARTKASVHAEVRLTSWDPDFYGTADALIVDEDSVKVIDLKCGKKTVEVVDNPQLMAYAVMASTMVDRTQGLIGIYQPSAEVPMMWMTIHKGHIAGWRYEFQKSINEARTNPQFRPGEKQCRFCKARPTCAARLKQVTEAFGVEAVW